MIARRCYRGTLSGAGRAQGLGIISETPGDGACLWHAAAKGFHGDSWHTESTTAFKGTIMTLLQQQPQLVGQWLGSSPEAATSIAEQWEPWEAWAAARALTLLSLYHGVSILVINQMDDTLELYTPESSIPSVGVTWVLDFFKDHFSLLNVQDTILSQFQLSPLHNRAPDELRDLRGGSCWSEADTRSVAERPPSKATSHMFSQCCGLTSPLKACDAMRCHTWNVGGLRTQCTDVLEVCRDNRVIIALQETNVSRQVQRSMEYPIREKGCSVIWGTPSPYTRDPRGSWRVDRGIPGVAFIHTNDTPLYTAPPRSEAGRSLLMQGRLLIAALPSQQGGPRFFMNIYAPAGQVPGLRGKSSFLTCLRNLVIGQTCRYVSLVTSSAHSHKPCSTFSIAPWDGDACALMMLMATETRPPTIVMRVRHRLITWCSVLHLMNRRKPPLSQGCQAHSTLCLLVLCRLSRSDHFLELRTHRDWSFPQS